MNITERSMDEKHQNRMIFDGYVVQVPNSCSGEIKIRIDNIDSDIIDSDLPKAFPLLPLTFSNTPKLGDRCRVMFYDLKGANHKSFQGIRLYIPVYSAYQNMADDPYHYSANSHEPDGFSKLNNQKDNQDIIGLYPTVEDVALIGKDNSDIILKPSEVLIRAGQKTNTDTFNQLDPAYIQLKHGLPELTEEIKKESVTKQIIIPAEFEIKITGSDDNYTLTVFDIKSGDQLSSSTGNLSEIKDLFRSNVDVYDKYILSNEVPELDYLPKVFKDNIRTVTEVVETKVKSLSDKNSGSIINLVADRINLLSHKSQLELGLTDQPDYITPQQQNNINSKAYALVLGEILQEFLEIVQDVVANHTHPYSNLPATKSPKVLKMINYDIEKMLSKHIKLTD